MKNIYNLILKNNQHQLEKIALTQSEDSGEQRSYTYQALFEAVQTFSTFLKQAQVVSGDRIAIVAENSPEWNIAFLAILKMNCTAVLIDASLSSAEILTLLQQSDVRSVYTSPKMVEKIDPTSFKLTPVLNILNKGQAFPGYLAEVSPQQEKTADGDPSIATIIFSSGTTRTAQGIMHSHEALIDSTLMCATSNNLDEFGRYLSVIPNSHIYGLICLVLAPMLLGADIRYIESMNAEAIKKAFDDYQPTVFPCVPKVFDMFKTQAIKTIESQRATNFLFKLFFPLTLFLRKKFALNLGKVVFKSIHQAFGGKIDILCSAGAPMDEATADFYLGTGFDLLITYGATETNIPTIGNWGKNLTADTCGQAYPDVNVKLSETGEILINSPYMMKGYFRNPVATAEAFEDGWIKTGDIAVLDKKGNYRIVGRSKENIILATGKKLTPDDVELQYGAIAGISEWVVSGVPSKSGSHDEVHAFAVKENAAISSEAVLAAFHQKGLTLPPYMKLTKVHLVAAIPKTTLQKPKRYLLKKYASEQEQVVPEMMTVTTEPAINLATELVKLVAQVGELDVSLVGVNDKPFSDLGLDSLSAMTLAFQIEEKYNIKVDEFFSEEITINQLADFIENPIPLTSETVQLLQFPQGKKAIDYFLFKCACTLARVMYKVTVKNQKMIPDDSGYIICANHVSNLDYLWLSLNFKKKQFSNFCCMAKAELVNKAGISQLLARVCGMIPVNRESVGVESLAYCKDRLKANAGLLIHPEGTRSITGELGKLKQGAAILAIESGVPIVPAYIKGAYEIYPRNQKLPLIFNFAKMRKYPVEVVYGAPIFPDNHSAEELIKVVEQAIMFLHAESAQA